jgi:hypothetical protein
MTATEQLEQKLDHAKRVLAKLDGQKKLLDHYEQRFPHMPQFAQQQRQSVRSSMHHLEDAILDIQKFKGEMA